MVFAAGEGNAAFLLGIGATSLFALVAFAGVTYTIIYEEELKFQAVIMPSAPPPPPSPPLPLRPPQPPPQSPPSPLSPCTYSCGAGTTEANANAACETTLANGAISCTATRTAACFNDHDLNVDAGIYEQADETPWETTYHAPYCASFAGGSVSCPTDVFCPAGGQEEVPLPVCIFNPGNGNCYAHPDHTYSYDPAVSLVDTAVCDCTIFPPDRCPLTFGCGISIGSAATPTSLFYACSCV